MASVLGPLVRDIWHVEQWNFIVNENLFFYWTDSVFLSGWLNCLRSY